MALNVLASGQSSLSRFTTSGKRPCSLVRPYRSINSRARTSSLGLGFVNVSPDQS